MSAQDWRAQAASKGRRRAARQRGPHQGPVAAARRRAGGRGRRERRRRRAGGPRPRDGRGRAGLRPLVAAGRGRRALGLREAGSAAGRRRRRGALRGARAGRRGACDGAPPTAWRFTRRRRRAAEHARARAELCSVAWAAACLAHESERHLEAAVDTVAAAHGALAADADDDGARDAGSPTLGDAPTPPGAPMARRGGCARSTTRAWRWRRPARRKSNWRPSTPRRPMN